MGREKGPYPPYIGPGGLYRSAAALCALFRLSVVTAGFYRLISSGLVHTALCRPHYCTALSYTRLYQVLVYDRTLWYSVLYSSEFRIG